MAGRFQLHRQKRRRVPVQGGGEACLQEQLHEGHQQGHQQNQPSPTDNHNPISLNIANLSSLQTFKLLDADNNDKLDFNEFQNLSK